jgi:3-hydroxy-9,10-secoandrosta-1,3,5(10)-triene-9,17-dione monooxygenase
VTRSVPAGHTADVPPQVRQSRTDADPAGYPPGEGPGSTGTIVGRDTAARERLGELLEAARALRPQLRANQAETEVHGRYAPEIHQAFVDAGFFRIMQPKSLGGLELGVEAFYQVITEVARGCPSTAWCLCLSAGHTLTLASYWGEEAQREIFGEHGYIVSPASFNAQPDAVITADERDGVPGLRVSGTWKYCSGAPYSTHFMPSFVRQAEDRDEPAVYWAVVPRPAYTVLDDWGGIIGMRGSGSNSIHIDNAFVPGHHVTEAAWTSQLSGETAGSRLHGRDWYAGPFTAFAEGEIAAVTAGLGLAAIDEYERIITSSKAPMTARDMRRSEHPVWQGKFGTALALVDSAVALSGRGGQWYEEFARQSVCGEAPFSAERALRLNNLYLVAENQIWAAIEMMLSSAGSRHSADGARLQRYFRDMVATRTRTDQLDLFAPTTTQAHLGKGLTDEHNR